MTRSRSIVLLSIITVLVLFLGVFSFIGSFSVGEYEKFYSPSYLIQKGNGLTDSIKATYLVELDEGANLSDVQRIIKARLRNAYGYYGVGIKFDGDSAVFTIPTTNNEAKTSATTILTNVVANGNIEILSSSTYSEDNVVLTQEHFRRAKVRSYVSGSSTWYLVEIKLTNEGVELAEDAFTSGNMYNFAVDGDTENGSHYADYTAGTIRLYGHSQDEAKLYASYVKSGALNATFTEDEISEPSGGLGIVFLIVVGALFLATALFFAIRYKGFGLVAALAQLIAVVLFTIFGGLVYLEILNVAAAIGIVLVYAFMTFFSVCSLEKIREYRSKPENQNKMLGKALDYAFKLDKSKGVKSLPVLNLIAHGALLVLGVILWVIPTAVTAPLGNVFVYGAILSFVVTFGLNRLFAFMLTPFYNDRLIPARKSAK